MWKKVPRENPCMHEEKMQIPIRKERKGKNAHFPFYRITSNKYHTNQDAAKT